MNIGKSRITLRAEGCIDCGAKWCHRWETARVVKVVIDGRETALGLNRCGDCAAKRAPLLNVAEVRPEPQEAGAASAKFDLTTATGGRKTA